MKVLVDTPIWSLALRRRRSPVSAVATSELAALVQDGRVAVIGPIRQELLSGIKESAQLNDCVSICDAFSDTNITSDDYEEEEAYCNGCRAKGIQGSNTDFLICAIAARNQFAIFTTDDDFQHFAKILPIVLHTPSE